MTEEEKARQELEYKVAEAKLRCKEVWTTLQQLNKIAKSYLDDWERWNERFERADRKLAEVDGRMRVVKSERKMPKIRLTREQILKIAEALEIEMEGEEGGEIVN
uniref:Uncharacterized protein n=1 Tax=viral metagenome TaxID=1070528 RepID=A0A6H1ZAJ2_9ZZZZ